jgi:hypothetical protein
MKQSEPSLPIWDGRKLPACPRCGGEWIDMTSKIGMSYQIELKCSTNGCDMRAIGEYDRDNWMFYIDIAKVQGNPAEWTIRIYWDWEDKTCSIARSNMAREIALPELPFDITLERLQGLINFL